MDKIGTDFFVIVFVFVQSLFSSLVFVQSLFLVLVIVFVQSLARVIWSHSFACFQLGSGPKVRGNTGGGVSPRFHVLSEEIVSSAEGATE
ncbi:MAG: hypothetical protein K6E86_04220, partial [Bacteroidales bacterium]|nr:hypothetical protein [Bacteroidales bacterium]